MVMRQPGMEVSADSEEFEAWLTEQVRRLSVDALGVGVATCTACGEIQGDYIIEFQGEKLRYPLHTAYGFLKFVLDRPN
jgi:hypothetical protein